MANTIKYETDQTLSVNIQVFILWDDKHYKELNGKSGFRLLEKWEKKLLYTFIVTQIFSNYDCEYTYRINRALN